MTDLSSTEIRRQYDALQASYADPAVNADPDALRRIGQESARLEPIVTAFERVEGLERDLAEARTMRDDESDPELRALAREEMSSLEPVLEGAQVTLRSLLLPRDPNDERDILIELRAGAGGDEAAIFAADLLRMYLRFAERSGFKAELLSKTDSINNGARDAVVEIHGLGAYSRFKFESGVHRVQRVPATETAGRIHTSTATVAVLPKVEETEVVLDPKEVRIDLYCATGPGGQGVNTTYSAVRLTHLPTGIVVAIQDEKSQTKNKEKAYALLRARIAAAEQAKAHAAEDVIRRGMVGSGDRAEKIRTYNAAQDRITDHRIGLDLHNLDSVLDGDLGKLVDALATADEMTRLEAAGPPA
jgi:peptide chain release factor 1